MKHFFKLMLLCATVAFILPSCSKDDDENVPQVDYSVLYGTWYDDENTSDKDGNEFTHYWVFKADKTCSQNLRVAIWGIPKTTTSEFTYTYDGKTITTTSRDGKDNVHKHPVTIKGNKMILGDGNGGSFNLTRK